MKSERRHELQKNTLAQFLKDLPFYIRFHANKILIAVIVVCLAILLIRYRMNQTAQAKLAIRSSLTAARMGIEELKFIDRTGLSDLAKAQQRRTVTGQVNSDLDTIFQNISASDDPSLRAQALIARGDLFWTLAGLPTLPGAATQPAMAQAPTAELMQNAEDAYKKALAEYDSEKQAKAAALFGLAAIDENREQFDKAADYYNSIIQDPGIAQIFQAVARQRLSLIPEIRKPTFLGSFSSTQPTSLPTSLPTSQASSQPTTQTTATAATMPATAPTTNPQ